MKSIVDFLLALIVALSWAAALFIGSVAYGEEICGPIGCLEVAGNGCYVESQELQCSNKPIECYGLNREQAVAKYGAAVGDLCDYTNYLERQEEKLFVCKSNAHRLRRQMRRQRRK